MNLPRWVVAWLTIEAARARPRVRVGNSQKTLERLGEKLLQADELSWLVVCLDAQVCPACLWPLDHCPDCIATGEEGTDTKADWCPHCDIHWDARLDLLATSAKSG